MAKTYTVIDILHDEERALVERLSIVRNRIARLKRGDVCSDSVTVSVPLSSQSVSVSGIKSAGIQ